MRISKQLVLLGVVFAALAAASPALASRPHQFSRTFGTPCLAEPLCTGESMFKPAGVAVNEATGDVYVVDEGEAGTQTGRVVRFNAKGEYLSEFNGSGTLSGTEPGTGTPWSEGKEAGSGPGEVKTGRFEAPLEASNRPLTIAVDNTCVLQKWSEPKCNSEDPSHGDVYVVDAGHRVVDKYSPSGEYLGQIAEGEEHPASEPGVKQRFDRALDGVAVDPQGDVWVYPESLVLQRYDTKTPNSFIKSEELDLPLSGLPGFAMDPAGDFYMRWTAPVPGDAGIREVSSSGQPIHEALLNEDSNAVAVDQLSSDILIDNNTSVAVLSPEGTENERLGEENGAKHLKEAAGIGVNASHVGGSVIYVADAGSGVVDEFIPSEPAPPKVESESVGEVTADLANLGGEVNPRSEVGEAATRYWLEYGECASLAACAGSGYAEAPGSSGEIPGDFNVHAVAFELTGLKAGTVYHFRVVAENAHDPHSPVPGEERTFTTEGAGGSLTLPDDRGWELVSPPDKQGARIEPISETGVVQAAASGDALTYLANAPTEAEPQGYSNEAQVLSRRGTSSWSSRDLGIPHTSPTGLAGGAGPEYKFFDPELNLSAVQPFGEFIPQLSAEASESTAYLHDLTTPAGSCTPTSSCYVPLVTRSNDTTDPFQPFGEAEECKPHETGAGIGTFVFCGPEFLGATEDLAHVVLRSKVPLAEGAGPSELYEWSAGQLTRVSVLPDGSPAAGAGLGDEAQGAARRAISSDGTLVVWGAHEALYVRDTALGQTVQLDEASPECKVGCESGGGQFQIASTDGSRVFFTDENRLTTDSGATPEKRADLYECRIVTSPKLACELTDLTPARGSEGAEVQGNVLGASEDDEYVYFVAKGVLSEAPNDRGQKAQAKQPNLYLRRGAETEFIATLAGAVIASLAGGDNHDWEGARAVESLTGQPTRVSADGRYLELMSEASLTGYDNSAANSPSGQPAAEVYLYDAASGRLACASCDPSGARPIGVEYDNLAPPKGVVGGPRDTWPLHALVAANVPGWTAIGSGNDTKTRYQPRYLSGEGRLFFDTANALVPQDTNGTQDVYEYEPPGIGDCTETSSAYSERSGGCVSLISSGSSSKESAFLDASESGDDVFFLTFSKLSPLDTDEAADVYDAHVCTGASPCIAFPNVQSPPCTTEASCKAAPTPQPSVFGAPASSTFQGLGNLAPAAAVKAKAKPLTRAQKLAAALKACQKDRSKSKRAKCQKAAHKRFGPIKRAKKKAKK